MEGVRLKGRNIKNENKKREPSKDGSIVAKNIKGTIRLCSLTKPPCSPCNHKHR